MSNSYDIDGLFTAYHSPIPKWASDNVYYEPIKEVCVVVLFLNCHKINGVYTNLPITKSLEHIYVSNYLIRPFFYMQRNKL